MEIPRHENDDAVDDLWREEVPKLRCVSCGDLAVTNIPTTLCRRCKDFTIQVAREYAWAPGDKTA